MDSLARYDDAEDEIRDEDHNLLLNPPKAAQAIEDEAESKPSPSPGSNSAAESKPKILVPYGGDDYSDDDSSGSENENQDETNKNAVSSKPAIVNLGLFDGTTVLSSGEADSPKPMDTNDSSPRPAEISNDNSVSLPPEPPGRCSKSLQEKIAKMIEKKRNGHMNVNEYVQRKKEFRNPSIYDKLVNFIGIEEHGTNFPREIYDPSVWGPDSYYEALAKTQKEYNTQKEKEKLKKTHVEFISGTKKTVISSAPTVTSSIPEKKSKWDQKVPPPPKVPPGVQAAIKSNNK